MKWRGPFGGGAASGASGAVVAAHAKTTQYLRARTTPVNPRSVFQQAVRNAVKALTSLWQTMTIGQRDVWDVYGTNVTVTNSLGDASKLSGFNWFVANNTVRLQAGLPAIQNGPTIFDVGNPDWSTIAPEFSIAANGTLGTLTLAAAIPVAGGTNGHLTMFISRPYGPAINFFNGPYRLTNVITSGSSQIAAGSYTFQSAFTASGVSSSGSANQMQLVLRLDQGDGRVSSRFQVQAWNF